MKLVHSSGKYFVAYSVLFKMFIIRVLIQIIGKKNASQLLPYIYFIRGCKVSITENIEDCRE